MVEKNKKIKGMTKPALSVFTGHAQQVPPIWLMRQAGRYLPEYRALRAKAGDFLDLCYNSDFAAEVTLQPVKRFSLDAAILFSDILVVPHALGQELEFVEGEGPKLRPVRNVEDLKRLSTELNHNNLSAVYETVTKVYEQLEETVTLIGFAGAPWTVATYMVEGGASRNFEYVKQWAFSSPETFDILIQRLVEGTTEHLCRQIEAGAEVVQLFESWAGILPPSDFDRWCIKPVRAIVETLRRRFPGVPVIGYPRGAGVMYTGYARATLVDVLGLDHTLPLQWISETLQRDVVVQGNLDPQLLVVGGTPMIDAVKSIKKTLGGRPFVFNLGHGVLPGTPLEHVSELVDLVREE